MASELRAMRLVGFRGFKDAGLELRPLTVLLGPNSAGKSSFGQALAGLKQVHEARAREPDLRDDTGAERLVDLGSHTELAHRGSSAAVQIHVRMPSGWVELGFGGTDVSGKPFPGFPITELELPKGQDVPQVGAALPLPSAVPQGAAPTVEQTISDRTLPAQSGAHFASVFRRHQRATWSVIDSTGATGFSTTAKLEFQGLQLIGVRDANTGSAVSFSPIGLTDLIWHLERLQYLRPSRLDPQRTYERVRGEGIGASGQRTPHVLLERAGALVNVAEPPQCPRSPEEAGRLLRLGTRWDTHQISLRSAVDYWFRYLELATAVVPGEGAGGRARVDVDLGGTARPLTDVGHGLSQVLPIIVAGLLLEPGGMLVVEQPEAQLHPRPQAALADFFCALVKTGQCTLVETHSEAFFHRLRLRASLDDELASQLGVYFVDRPTNGGVCSNPVLLPLVEQKELKWPAGFMTEGVEEELSIVAIREARRRGSKK